MKTIKIKVKNQIEVKRSKFISHSVPIAEFKGMQDRLKAENPKASHVIYALRYLNSYNQIVENSSDDGEPKGCAGTPTLNVLRGNELIDCAILTVRYFGGTKLGTGGMIRAYTDSAKSVLEIAEPIEHEVEKNIIFNSTYSMIQQIEYLLSKVEITSIKKDFSDSKVKWIIKTTEEKFNKFKSKIGRSIEICNV